MSLFFTQNEMESKLKKFAEENRENVSFASSVPRDSSSLYLSFPPSSSSSQTDLTSSLSSSSHTSVDPNLSSPHPSASPSILPPGLTDLQSSSSFSLESEKAIDEKNEKVEEQEGVVEAQSEEATIVKGIPTPMAKGMRPKRKLGKSHAS